MKAWLVYDPIYLEHNTGKHPENASRLISIMSHLKQTGIEEATTSLQPHIASKEDLERVHSERYVAKIRHTAESGGGWLDPDTFVCSKSYEAALYAAGGLLVDC
jgi:acetoin utilization deacetylase AcuC-like enzyme